MIGLALLMLSSAASAQVTTGGIRGTVRDDRGQPTSADVRVRQDSTGYSTAVRASASRFLVQGLEPGGPYSITIRAVGFLPQQLREVYVTLGTLREIDVVLQPVASRLDTVHVAPQGEPGDLRSRAGSFNTISATTLDRMPAQNRDLYDFLRLVPQITTRIPLGSPGFSAAGAGFRYNNFLINGVSERTPSGGVSSAFGGLRSVPLAAVQEYHVLLSPYDVRYGDFGGALVNAVTRAGTNSFHGSAFAYGRDGRFSRIVNGDSSASFDRVQYGASLSGPIVKDRLQFLVAPEVQRYTYPAAGPYVGQPASAAKPVPVSSPDLARFDAIMRSDGLTTGSPGAVENRTPLENLFTRLDLSLPEWASRVVLWDNYGGEDQVAFSRASIDTFSLASTVATTLSQTHMTALHVHTELPRAGGGHNELLVSTRSEYQNLVGDIQQPIVRVLVPSATPSLTGAQVLLNSGTTEAAQLGGFRSKDVTIKDNVTLPFGASHVAALGAEMERFHYRRGVGATSYGTWNFASLDDFAAGRASRYDVAIDYGAMNDAMVGAQYAGYLQDQWRMTDRLSVTGGVRADLLAFDGHAPYNPQVDSIFGRRTDVMPRRRVELSPRVGFVWDSAGADGQQLRGGVGVFTGRYPLAWPHSALLRYGVGNATLSCTAGQPPPLGISQQPPAFTPRPTPTTCAGSASTTPNLRSDVDLLARDLQLVRTARASLAYERQLPSDVQLSAEALVSRGLSDLAFQNLNLNAPRGLDRYGRVMYDSVLTSGKVLSTRRSPFREVIDLLNGSSSHSWQLTTRLESGPRAGVSGSVSYTYGRAWDAQTPTRVNTTGTMAWASARVSSGRDDDLSATTSSEDIRHRVIIVGNYEAPWQHARTELSFYYIGESGRPFTYTAYGTDGRGDLNADGSSTNDPIYIPRRALDTTEIRFSGDSAGADTSAASRSRREQSQRTAFEQFIARTPCLRNQRGKIMARNSCREPWSNTTIASLRQQLPTAPRMIDVELDVFNVLNLIRQTWGLRRVLSSPGLLEQYQQTTGPSSAAQPIFRFDPGREAWLTDPAESGFQVQLAARFHF